MRKAETKKSMEQMDIRIEDLPRALEIDISTDEFSQNDLVMLSCLPTLQHLALTQSLHRDNVPQLDFSKLSFLHLETLVLDKTNLKTLILSGLSYPRLVNLVIEDQINPLDRIVLSYMPCLETVTIQFTRIVDPWLFASSLSSCLRLKTIACYKLLGLGVYNIPLQLYLPECSDLAFEGSEDLPGLILFAPKLKYLCVKGCVSFRRFKAINHKPKVMSYLLLPKLFQPFSMDIREVYISPCLLLDLQNCSQIQSLIGNGDKQIESFEKSLGAKCADYNIEKLVDDLLDCEVEEGADRKTVVM